MYKAIEKWKERERESTRETTSVEGEGGRLSFKEQGVSFPVAVTSQHPSA